MRPEEKESAHLWDMLDAARTVLQMTAGTTLAQYLADRKLQLAVERAVEIIGEAAGRVSESFRRSHPEIPWRGIIAQRHVLAHDYGDIKQDRMWNLATTHLPSLISKLEPLVPQPPDDRV